MAQLLGTLLLAGLAAAVPVYLYDSFVSGPGWVRVLGTLAAAVVACWLLGVETPRDLAVVGAAAATVALSAVALLQLLVVQRDVALTTVLRRR